MSKLATNHQRKTRVTFRSRGDNAVALASEIAVSEDDATDLVSYIEQRIAESRSQKVSRLPEVDKKQGHPLVLPNSSATEMA